MMNKKILVTGASRGIGAAVARELAASGYDLFLVCRTNGQLLEKLKAQLEAEFPIRCEAALCDVSDPQQVEEMVRQAGEIYALINNAGISYIGLLSEMTTGQWQQVIETNLSSVFYTGRAVIPQMVRRREGRILNVSSVWGNVGASMEVAYSASKGGVNSFTKALAKELAPSNIQVNAVAFGVIDTEMNRCFSKEERQALREEIPADRFGSAREAAAFLVQLLQAPEYLTGQVITVDGGWI